MTPAALLAQADELETQAAEHALAQPHSPPRSAKTPLSRR